MSLHYADLYEAAADAVPEAVALSHGTDQRLWGEFDGHAAHLSSALSEAGVVRDSKVAIYLYNCNEWMESFYAALKLRAVPVNVNYRYLDDELVYLLVNSDSEALFYHATFAERIARIRERLPAIRLYVQVDNENGLIAVPDWAVNYQTAIASHGPAARIKRSADDVMLTYTGGTTGLPKGVIHPLGLIASGGLRFAAGGLGVSDWPAEITPEFVVALRDRGETPVSCPLAPLMHSTGLTLGAMPTLAVGGCVVTLTSKSLDIGEALETIDRCSVTSIVIAGDAIARPLLRELEISSASGRLRDLSTLRVIVSSGVTWSSEVKLRLFEYLPHVVLQDSAGSTEGAIGMTRIQAGDSVASGAFLPIPGLKLIRDDGTEVEPGSGEPGRILTPSISLGYYNDPGKTLATFTLIDGVQYVSAGDFALRNTDGSITLLGRGSSVINTGGEKVFAEEVEEAIKTYPGVADCLVIGTPSERFGSQVSAVVSLYEPGEVSARDIISHVQSRLAGYKAPRLVTFVDVVPRHPNGKADLDGARRLAAKAVAPIAETHPDLT